MDRNRLKDRIERIRGLNCEEYSEAKVKQFIIVPILDSLDWPVYEPGEVDPEYKTGGRVDYALLQNGKPVVLLEAKGAAENLPSHTEQLLQYAWRQAVPIAVLTNGLDWSFYLPWEKREWDKRLFCSIHLRTDDIDILCDRFIQFLSKEKVISGEAAQAAQNMLYGADIQEGMLQAWNAIVEEPHFVLLDLIAQATQEQCGHKPDVEAVRAFLVENRQRLLLSKKLPPPLPPPKGEEDDAKKGWYYWEDKGGRGYILRFVNALGSCRMRRFDAESGKFLYKPSANPNGDYQVKFAEYIRPDCLLQLSQKLSVKSCEERLPDWAMREFKRQIQTILESHHDT
jgi:hypothetical protein